jgi:NAD(P)-dependent dehydrogenase (short-subunit alcohol dehydrogenase family)
VRVRETVSAVIDRHISYFGSVDIIANCTGYGVIGSCEDQDDYDLRNQFATNFMGTLHIIQLSLPHFRQQGHGRYLVFSSTAGALGVPGLGPYCATKYAVEGLIESMLYEIDVFGIKATLVEPGHVRLDEPDDVAAAASEAFMARMGMTVSGTPLAGAPGGAGASSSTAAAAAAGAANSTPGPPKPKRYGHFWVKPNPSPPYAPLNSPARHAKRMVQWLNDRQPVSAVKSAELVWQLGHCSYPPLRLLLGSYAVDSIRDRLRSIIEEVCISQVFSIFAASLSWVGKGEYERL